MRTSVSNPCTSAVSHFISPTATPICSSTTLFRRSQHPLLSMIQRIFEGDSRPTGKAHGIGERKERSGNIDAILGLSERVDIHAFHLFKNKDPVSRSRRRHAPPPPFVNPLPNSMPHLSRIKVSEYVWSSWSISKRPQEVERNDAEIW